MEQQTINPADLNGEFKLLPGEINGNPRKALSRLLEWKGQEFTAEELAGLCEVNISTVGTALSQAVRAGYVNEAGYLGRARVYVIPDSSEATLDQIMDGVRQERKRITALAKAKRDADKARVKELADALAAREELFARRRAEARQDHPESGPAEPVARPTINISQPTITFPIQDGEPVTLTMSQARALLGDLKNFLAVD